MGFLESLLKTGLPLMQNVLKTLAKSVFRINSSSTSSGSNYSSKNFQIWYDNINNFEWRINDIMKIVKPLVESGLLIRSVSETIQNEVKE